MSITRFVLPQGGRMPMGGKGLRRALMSMALSAGGAYAAGDVDVKLTTNDGTTKMTVTNSVGTEVGSVDSLGNATFNSLSVTSGGAFIQNQNTLQAGATFYVSS